ncbi:hypothetical protein ABE073_02790 [Lederbergia citrisecunda]|uniref:hypothetical protein n=1 Tax=Lederbergia citrisecunda TaxID=2833583 RepID=UPI003D2E8876
MEKEPTEVEKYEFLVGIAEDIDKTRKEKIFGNKDILNFEFKDICHVTNNHTEIILPSLFPFYKGDIIQLTKKYDDGYIAEKETDPEDDPKYVLRCEVIENIKRGIFSKGIKIRPKKLFHIKKKPGGHSIIDTLIFIYLREEYYSEISKKNRHEVVFEYDDLLNGRIRYLYESLDLFNKNGFPHRTGFSSSQVTHLNIDSKKMKLELSGRVELFDDDILWVTPDGSMTSRTEILEPLKDYRKRNYGRLFRN